MLYPYIKFADATAGENDLHKLNFLLFSNLKYTFSQNWVF